MTDDPIKTDDRDPADRLLAALPPARKPKRKAEITRAGKIHRDLIGKTAICQNPACGKDYTARPGESMADWLGRRACSNACGRAVGKQVWRGGLGRLGKGNF